MSTSKGQEMTSPKDKSNGIIRWVIAKDKCTNVGFDVMIAQDEGMPSSKNKFRGLVAFRLMKKSTYKLVIPKEK